MTVPPEIASRVRLVASDLDGTLLTSDKRISPRTKAALQAAHRAGIVLVAATGRQLGALPPDLQEAGIDYLIAGNGAHGYRFSTDETLFMFLLAAKTQAEIVSRAKAHIPGVTFGASRETGKALACEPGYLELMTPEEKRFDLRSFRVMPVGEMVVEPTLKLIARHADLSPDALLDAINRLGLTGFYATTSGAPFVEIEAEGVTKATGLAQLATLLDIEQADVLTAGDARNDIEMLVWAGCGVAMGNAVPETRAAADIVTATSDEDGLALVLEDLISARL